MNRKIFITGVAVLFIDQLTKILATTYIGVSKTVTIFKDFFYLTNISNTGAAFSLLEGRTIFLVGLTFLMMILLYRMISSFDNSKANNFAFGMLFGGILGNLGDRMFLGYVRDFIKFKIFGYSFPVFNFADVGIVLGVILLIYSILKGSEKNENRSR